MATVMPTTEPYPHVPAEQWDCTGCKVPLPEDWFKFGRRLILANGCKITEGTAYGEHQRYRHPITVDAGELPQDLHYLLRVICHKERTADMWLEHKGENNWEFCAV